MSRLAAWIAVALLALVPVSAHAVEEIDWKRLIPKLEPLKDPLTGLNQDQRFDIETIAWVRALSEEERKIPINKQGVDDAKKFERQFKELGIDVDELLRKYEAWLAKVEKRKKLVDNSLDGKRVKIAGYLLPLEYSEEGNTQFLLVPYVGACIHVPPPPPNQIAFVELKEKFQIKELYTPVYLTGVVRTKASSQKLNLVDGSADISIGYHIKGEQVTPYEKK